MMIVRIREFSPNLLNSGLGIILGCLDDWFANGSWSARVRYLKPQQEGRFGANPEVLIRTS